MNTKYLIKCLERDGCLRVERQGDDHYVLRKQIKRLYDKGIVRMVAKNSDHFLYELV